jgi:hypothetical protein
MNLENKITKAANIVLGSVPENWMYNLRMMAEDYRQMPEINPGYIVPYTTFILYVLSKVGINNQIIWAQNMIKHRMPFVETYADMKSTAQTTTNMDVLNMKAELDAFGSLENCIVKPKLAISPLYRYIIAQDTNMELLLTDNDTTKAIKQLRENPYFYFEYLDYVNLMPITWEEL